MGEGAWLVAFLVVQRVVELGFAQFNTERLRAEGGVEFGATHYPLMIALRRCLFTEFVSKTRRWPRLRRRREY